MTAETFLFLIGFLMVALAAKQLGEFFARLRLPKITGYLISGLLAGAFVLDFIPEDAVRQLHMVDEASLAFIAFAAGAELHLSEIRGRFATIGWVTAALVFFTFTFVSGTLFLLGNAIPFVRDLPVAGRIAVSIMAGAIMVARSPSSAIAVINELRARGAFTQVAIGVTVVMDVVVIVVFAINVSIADALLNDVAFNGIFVLLIVSELVLALIFAFLLFRFIHTVLSWRIPRYAKAALIVASGYGVFLTSGTIRASGHAAGIEILVEPLLVCVIASFLINNYDANRVEFGSIISELSPIIFVLFFTLTGASLELDVLAATWPVALALFSVRLVAIVLGTVSGGLLSGADPSHNRLRWMAFITQAGVALGLAKEVAAEFPELGNAFATMIISVVVLNELAGPVFFKYALFQVNEAHLRAPKAAFDGVRDVVIFGANAPAVSLARQLVRHDWQVKLVCVGKENMNDFAASDLEVAMINRISVRALASLDLARADALVSLLADHVSFEICRIAYEHFGTETMVVQIRDRANFEQFNDLGVLVVEPQTAVTSLLEHFVRSPVGTALLLGSGDGQDVIDVEVRNRDLHNVAIRDLGLPLDVMILAIHRDHQTLVVRGYTQLKLGDKISMVGREKHLAEAMLQFEA